MGLRKLKFIFVAVLMIAVIGTAAFLYTRSVDDKSFTERDNRFTDVFIEMALAREMVGDNPDSLDTLYSEIFKKYGVDSTWIFNYIASISDNAEKNKEIWDVILEKLDSLRKKPPPDST
jgi:hypothetical protein